MSLSPQINLLWLKTISIKAQTAVELDALIDGIVRGSADTLLERTLNLETRAWLGLSPFLTAMPVDRNGLVVRNSTSDSQLRKGMAAYAQVSTSDTYTNAVTEYLRIINQIRDLVEGYYAENITVNFSTGTNASIANDWRNDIRAQLLNDEYIGNIRSRLRAAIMEGIDRPGLIALGQSLTFGDQSQKRRMLRPILDTAPYQYANQLNRSMASTAKLEYVFYNGPKDDKNRDFCHPRAGQFFHFKEVQLWPQEEAPWQGMIPGTNIDSIWVNRGGFNCRHGFIYVEAKDVPTEVQQRAQSKGFVTGRQ